MSVFELGLSEEAKAVLIAAADDPEGIITKQHTFQGVEIITNKTRFVKDEDPRYASDWASAVKELIEYGFLADIGNGQEYFVTNEGYDKAEELKAEEDEE